MSKWTHILCLSCLPFFAAAQKANFHFYTTQDGLSGSFTHGIAQDRRGFLWVFNDYQLATAKRPQTGAGRSPPPERARQLQKPPLHQPDSRVPPPLTVILGMSGQIRDEPEKYLESGTHLIETNGQNLLRLINQLLDLPKLENKSFQLRPQQGDIVPYLRYVTESFQTFANSRNLSLRFFTTIETLVMDFDPEQIKQVMTNLISNAVKFTPSGGEIKVR